jgi:hypothetical protein
VDLKDGGMQMVAKFGWVLTAKWIVSCLRRNLIPQEEYFNPELTNMVIVSLGDQELLAVTIQERLLDE